MEQIVRHKGTVLSISGTHVKVKIVQHSACASCLVSSHCQVSESKEKIVDVFDAQSASYKIGDYVVVSTSRHMVIQALILGFIVPLILLLASLFLFLWRNNSEGLASLLSLCTLLPYYCLLWLFRKKMANTVSFHIEHA